MTAPQFQAGFESTQDSDVLVTGITTAPDGRPAADVTFISRQQPQDGPDGQSCTDWHVTLFFDGSAGSYTIGAPPAAYQASYQACSSGVRRGTRHGWDIHAVSAGRARARGQRGA